MEALWIVPATVVLAAVPALLLATRRVRDEAFETVRSFEAFLGALQPAVVVVRDETQAVVRRADGLARRHR